MPVTRSLFMYSVKTFSRYGFSLDDTKIIQHGYSQNSAGDVKWVRYACWWLMARLLHWVYLVVLTTEAFQLLYSNSTARLIQSGPEDERLGRYVPQSWRARSIRKQIVRVSEVSMIKCDPVWNLQWKLNNSIDLPRQVVGLLRRRLLETTFGRR